MPKTANPSLEGCPFSVLFNDRAKSINDAIGHEAFQYISKYSDIRSPATYIISAEHKLEIHGLFKSNYNKIIDIKPIDIKVETNQFIKLINDKLKNNGLFIGCFEAEINTDKIKANGLRNSKNENLQLKTNSTKTKSAKNISKKLIKTKLNLFGRFSYFGFEIISEKLIGKYNYFVAKKINNPSINPLPSASPIIKLNRVGQGGKFISIYKLRTMYPYSEYLQDYIFRNNQLESGGKFKNDFRIIKLGNFLRKYWIDELPMLINLFKGDIKIFGVRPLSEQYFNLYPQELKNFRIKFKPGLIPPYYVDMPNSFEAILNSEMKYLNEYQNSPLKTDCKYILKALFNILIKCKRSK